MFSNNIAKTYSMPKFNEDVITRQLRQTLLCDVLIFAYLILKRKKSEEFRG